MAKDPESLLLEREERPARAAEREVRREAAEARRIAEEDLRRTTPPRSRPGERLERVGDLLVVRID